MNAASVLRWAALALWCIASLPAQAPLQRWDDAVLAKAATLPVQEGGRIKPLSAYAAQMLYLIHGRRDMKLDLDRDGKAEVALPPIEWLLDVWFQPEAAADFPLFRIENVDVLDAIGVPHEGGQSFTLEYVSYRQLAGADVEGQQPAQRLWDLARRYRQKPQEDQTPVEAHIVRTNDGVSAFAMLYGMLEPFYAPFQVEGERLRGLFGGARTDFAAVLAKAPELAALIREHQARPEDPALGNALSIAAVMQDVAERQTGPALFPAAGGAQAGPVWRTLADLTEASLRGLASNEQLAEAGLLQQAVAGATMAERSERFVAFRDAVVARAAARGEFGKVELEDYYLSAAWHYRALHWFVLAVIVVAIGWIAPRSRLVWLAGLAAVFVPLAFLCIDIVLRCVVRGRPPILNLYDTFLFIAAVGVGAALCAEVITRRRVAIALAPIFGALLVMLARAFEVESGEDQMAPLQAVLDTNYYLATHVTSINMGYAAGMFASFLGTAWLLLQAIGFRRADEAFYKGIVRATYGVTAFGLIFAVFGTIYGGVWANDSWGRFWGWDPKENGALLICIAQVALLHARMGGMVRDFGFCLGAALTGLVVAFSWFHVNLLGIGLHAYGFSSATKVALFRYYYIQLGLCGLGAAGAWWRRSHASKAAANASGLPAKALSGN